MGARDLRATLTLLGHAGAALMLSTSALSVVAGGLSIVYSILGQGGTARSAARACTDASHRYQLSHEPRR